MDGGWPVVRGRLISAPKARFNSLAVYTNWKFPVMAEILIECPCGCGEKFSTIGSRGRARSYFSPACSLRVNYRPPDWTGRKHSPETRALLREKASVPKPWIRGEKNGMFGRTGESNPNWKGGTSPERQRLYAGSAWRQLRRKIRLRDRGICQRCGGNESTHMHHIQPWSTNEELRFDIDNIITLCRECHHDVHRKGGDAN